MMTRLISVLAAALLSFSVAFVAQANETGADHYEFDTTAQERQFNQLTRELRCPKCQNQSIADSDAPLAQDMRDRVYQMILEGQSDSEIIGFMKVRYGDFVHYRPPVNRSTIVLWAAPIAVVLIGLITVIFHVRGRRNVKAELSPEELARLDKILNKEGKD